MSKINTTIASPSSNISIQQNKRFEPGSAEEKAYQEGQKLVYDTFKHLTTVATGSILLMIGFLEKLFKSPQWKALIVVTFISFLLSVCASIGMMIMIATSIKQFGDLTKLQEKFVGLFFCTVLATFFIGLLCLVIFALKNFLLLN